ncbi:MAG: MFS transporter [Rubellimicrobium sp.]|nr:MFS transporter [Rubellimicrobium sp.]
MSSPPSAPAAARPQPQPPAHDLRLVIGSIAVLLLLASLDQTIVSTALPTIVADLGGLEHLSWVVTAYILTATIVAPLYGKLGDLYGRRNMVFLSVGLFLGGSALCGLSMNMAFLIAARALQGLGGGGLFVLALSVIGDVISPRDRAKFQGVFAAVFSLSSVLGPLIGGWFVDVASWHWIFYVNIPVGALAVAGFAIGFAPRGTRVAHRVDWAGAAALSVALASLILVTSLGGTAFAFASWPAAGLFALSVAAGAAFVRIEARAAEPILPLPLFADNVFRNTSIISFIVGAAMLGTVTFLPLYLQIAKGLSPTESGLMLIPMTAGTVISSNLAGQYMARMGRYRLLPVIGLGALALGALLLAGIDAQTGFVTFGAMILLVGLGMGSIFPVLTTAVQNAVPYTLMGTATAAGVMFRQIGGSLGVAVFGTIFAARLAATLGEGAAAISPMAETAGTGAALDPAARAVLGDAIAHALSPIYWITAAIALAGILFARLLAEVPLRGRPGAASGAGRD